MCAAPAPVHEDHGRGLNTRVFCREDGHSYHVNSVVRFGDEESVVFYPRCVKHKQLCRGTAQVVQYQNQREWFDGNRHTCLADRCSHLERLMRYEILQACRDQPYELPRHHLNRIAARFRFAMRRARLHQYPPIPVNMHNLGMTLEDVNFRNLTKTVDGTDNVCLATVGAAGQESIIFTSQRMLQFMSTCHIIFVDGTFSVTPALPAGAQVYQIVTVKRNGVIPLVTVYMKTRSYAAYCGIILKLREVVPNFRPRKACMDFEAAQQKAWVFAYPEVDVVGCYIHFIRAALAMAGELGLKRVMQADERVEKIVYLSLAIPLLPAALMDEGFAVLLQKTYTEQLFDVLAKYLAYFPSTWMSGWRSKVVSVCGEKHRTNNASESANRLLQVEIGPPHPSIWVFLDGIRRYEQKAYIGTQAFLCGRRLSSGRKLKTVLNDVAIKHFMADMLEGDISIEEFLSRSSRRLTAKIFNDLR